MFDSCATHRDALGAFVDGELSVAETQRVSGHLDGCASCAGEVDRLRGIGALLRGAARMHEAPPPMLGLAGGVVARIGAEAAQSWRAMFGRAVDDWHWVIVGGGSVAATFVSMLLVTALLFFGPAPMQQNSLAGLMSSLETHPGTLLVEVGDSRDTRLLQVATGAASVRVMPAMLGISEQDLVSAFTNAVVSKRGGLVDFASMPATERRALDLLLTRINGFRNGPAPASMTGQLNVLRIRLIATTGVSAPPLEQ
jgi:anti-sigma factor RsiW